MRSKTKLFFSLGIILIVAIGLYTYLNLNGTKNTKQKIGGLEKSALNIANLPTIPEQNRVRVKDGCVLTGCNSTDCADKEGPGLCVFEPWDLCYNEAYSTCERQVDGQCGWTDTPELDLCLEKVVQK